jgi:hypothetical protein
MSSSEYVGGEHVRPTAVMQQLLVVDNQVLQLC